MILDDILAKVKERYKDIEDEVPLNELKRKVNLNIESKFYDLFTDKFVFICECKKASPSKGIIKANYNYLEIAKEYEASGASCISCLTEPYFFLGSDKHLVDIKRNVNIPVLRKDFIISEYQIYESKVLGADAILLIVRILTKEELKKYIDLAHKLKLGVLVECHSEEEIDIAISCGAKVIGVNNRNLKDFSMDYSLALNLKKKYEDIILISESGLRNKDDVKMVYDAKMNGCLIGESLMRSDNISKTLGEYIHVC